MLHVLSYCTSYRLKPVSGTTMPIIRSWSSVRAAGYGLQPGHYSSLPAPNFEPTATQERDDQCGIQHSHELLMMGIVVPETC